MFRPLVAILRENNYYKGIILMEVQYISSIYSTIDVGIYN